MPGPRVGKPVPGSDPRALGGCYPRGHVCRARGVRLGVGGNRPAARVGVPGSDADDCAARGRPSGGCDRRPPVVAAPHPLEPARTRPSRRDRSHQNAIQAPSGGRIPSAAGAPSLAPQKANPQGGIRGNRSPSRGLPTPASPCRTVRITARHPAPPRPRSATARQARPGTLAPDQSHQPRQRPAPSRRPPP